MSNVIIGPRCNRRVSCSSNPQNDRSESALAINPNNPYHMVGASKKFTNPHTYDFSLIAYYSFDGGQTWEESVPLALLSPWSGVSDPAVTFDNLGNVFLLALPFQNFTGGGYQLYGMVAYKSTDGGKTWSPPDHIHNVLGDDKQWIVADNTPTSPYYGRVYASWDSGGIGSSQLCFGRTLDHGATWVGLGTAGLYQPTGTGIAGISDSGSPEINVGRDGTIYIVWWNGSSTIKVVKSTDGGDSFSAPITVASGITPIPAEGALPMSKFRNGSFPTACCGKAQHVIVAWADLRESAAGARIYYRHSPNGGSSWDGPSSGSAMLTGAVATASNQNDFHPQLACTPNGEVGCAFYEYGPHGGGEFPSYLIDVYLAVSVDNGASFDDRALVTDQPWDPTVDEVWAHGDSSVTFIGDYFGIDASRLGFFPFWTDTRTGVQEIFCSRLSPYPADVYIRDSSTDVGNVPSPGDHWEYVDVIVRDQPDGDLNFVNVPLYHDGVTDFYVYARVRNNGPNQAKNVTFTAVIGNYPALDGLPGSEFRYPQDWYKDDWDSAAMMSVHQYIGESVPATLNVGDVKILGPIVWPAAMIPTSASFDHPCLLVGVRANNNDSAGGPDSIPVPAEGDKNACNYGSFFWGSNDIAQRNLTYGTAPAGIATPFNFAFLVSNFNSPARFVEVVVNKGKELARVPMTLTMEPLHLKDGGFTSDQDCDEEKCCPEQEYVFVNDSHLVIKCGVCEIVELDAKAGTVLKHKCPATEGSVAGTGVVFGATGDGKVWQLHDTLSIVGFARTAGQAFKMKLSFVTPTDLRPGSNPIIRVYQRNDKKTISGGVALQLAVPAIGTSAQRVRRTRTLVEKKKPRRRR